MTRRIDPRYFIVTSQGVSATRWLAFALASHPKVFAAHGHFAIDSVANGKFQQEKSKDDVEALSDGNAALDLYEASEIDDIFAAYRSLRPDADAYGNVHSYTLDDLLRRRGKNARNREFALANVVRHPVSYIDSHFCLVRKAERHPMVYRSYAFDQFPRALRKFRELFRVDCPDFREFLAFATSCYSVLNVARDLAHQQYQHHRMESLTTDGNALGAFCETLTGLTYRQEDLDAFVTSGPINRHRKLSDSADPWTIYRAWPYWKREIAAMMIPETVLASFENVGYELGMLRHGRGEAKSASAAVPCLADFLKSMDENHPLLGVLRERAPTVYGVAKTLGRIRDLAESSRRSIFRRAANLLSR